MAARQRSGTFILIKHCQGEEYSKATEMPHLSSVVGTSPLRSDSRQSVFIEKAAAETPAHPHHQLDNAVVNDDEMAAVMSALSMLRYQF